MSASRPTAARIERGNDVSTATLVKVATALGLSVEITEPGETSGAPRARRQRYKSDMP